MNTPSHRTLANLALAAITATLVSCASGPSYATVKPTLPPIAKGQGRVFVYRPSSFGAAAKASVKIDQKPVGTSEAQGFFYSDQPAGNHEISIATEWNHKSPLVVTAGKPSYVECHVTPGVFIGHIIPRPIDSTTGEANIQSCKTGSP